MKDLERQHGYRHSVCMFWPASSSYLSQKCNIYPTDGKLAMSNSINCFYCSSFILIITDTAQSKRENWSPESFCVCLAVL